jgi:thermostable 8-oxoguanine DNA glycosylase
MMDKPNQRVGSVSNLHVGADFERVALEFFSKQQIESHRTAKAALATLLREPGVDLAMASTFLRFRNSQTFQIIDRHAYRAVYGEDYPLYSSSSNDAKIELYVCYLDRLFALAESKKVDFKILDRVLYLLDKHVNGKL